MCNSYAAQNRRAFQETRQVQNIIDTRNIPEFLVRGNRVAMKKPLSDE